MKKWMALLFVLAFLNVKPQTNKQMILNYLDSLQIQIDSLGIQEPVYVMAQAIYETGWFQCKNCTWSNKNMFGFRALNGKYMKFKSWRVCLNYYAKWQGDRYKRFKEKYPKGDYIKFLKWSRFAESPNYSKKIIWTHEWIIKNWINEDDC
jgi:flagellum-specific peptidoglycan hydrolase FlgJ